MCVVLSLQVPGVCSIMLRLLSLKCVKAWLAALHRLPLCVHLCADPGPWTESQAGARGMLARADARRERRLQAAVTIQRSMRMLRARSQFITTKTATLVIQSAWRGHVARSVAMDIRYTTA